MNTREGMKALLAIAWMAAYLQSQFPDWVGPETPRIKVPPDKDRWIVPWPYEFETKWEADPPPYFDPPHPDIVIDLVEYRICTEGVSNIFDGLYKIGLGFGYYSPEYGGVMLYWIKKWDKLTVEHFEDFWNYGRA